jgi:hypothetical protein
MPLPLHCEASATHAMASMHPSCAVCCQAHPDQPQAGCPMATQDHAPAAELVTPHAEITTLPAVQPWQPRVVATASFADATARAATPSPPILLALRI